MGRFSENWLALQHQLKVGLWVSEMIRERGVGLQFVIIIIPKQRKGALGKVVKTLETVTKNVFF